ncbi:dehydrogenase [Neoasaia chiangmaiensis NBRC 101099]|nr:SDR family oxidoreductase [Neoasaia chiangmaiensis]GBR40072.1 dehydrogenase [Neoasaia chiangmaiensis NBRC 101099]GEN14871.1 hypothetical protein NCH01_13020 [Neoasaia chiangmaiensis]
MALTNTELRYYDSNVLRLPADKRKEYHAQVDRLIEELRKSVKGKTEIKITKVVKAGSFAKFTILRKTTYDPVDVDVVFYISGRDASKETLDSLTDADWQAHLAVNLTGTFNGLREGARRVRDGGRIVSLSTSIVGTYLPAHGVYVATKAAVEALTRVLAKELGPRGITVNAVAPGPVGTELFFTGRPPAVVERIVADVPMGRLGTPEDVARVVAFLAGPDGGWVSGQVIRANGGRN